MTFRKLSAYLPSAMLVGTVVHVAGAGFGHAPGGRFAPAFAGSLGAALLAALAVTFGAAAFATLRRMQPGRSRLLAPFQIATARSGIKSVAGLAVGGTAAYVAIEFLEGHAGLGGALRALLASFPVAATVAALFRRVAGVAGRAGIACALAVTRTRRIVADTRFVARVRARTFTFDRKRPQARRGRAPPLFV